LPLHVDRFVDRRADDHGRVAERAGAWTGGSLADVNDPRWAETVMGCLPTPRRALMVGFLGIHRDGTRASIRRSVGTGCS
jgi:hypothetical protein